MTKIVKWIGLALVSLWAVVLLSPDAAAQLNRIALTQIVGYANIALLNAANTFVNASAQQMRSSSDGSTLTLDATTTLKPGIVFHNVTTGNLGTVFFTNTKDFEVDVNNGGTIGMQITAAKAVTLPGLVSCASGIVSTSGGLLSCLTQPALTHATPANQTGNATATFKMNGLGAAGAPCVITPVSSGRVIFMITGQVVQNTTADGVTYKLAYGTGAAPANAAAATGTVISATQTWTALTGNLTEQFAITAPATGLALSTALWYDLQVADVTGGTASITNVDCTAHEV